MPPSGNDSFAANFAAAGTSTAPMVTVTDKNPANVGYSGLYTLQSFSNFNTINLQGLGGDDTTSVVGRTDGSLKVNVDGGAGNDTLALPGTVGADSYTVTPGASSDAGTVAVTYNGSAATTATTVYYSTLENISIDGGGGGNDTLTVNGTPGADSFALKQNLDVNGNPIAYAGTLSSSAASTVAFQNFGALRGRFREPARY